MTREEAIERFNGIINAMSISIAQSKFYPSKAELNELCDMAISALKADALLKQEIDFHKEVSRIEAEKVVDLEHKLADAVSREEHYDAVANRITDMEERGFVSVVRCKKCKFKSLHDDGDTKYYYCALEDRPNRQWSVDDTDYCSWGERQE